MAVGPGPRRPPPPLTKNPGSAQDYAILSQFPKDDKSSFLRRKIYLPVFVIRV